MNDRSTVDLGASALMFFICLVWALQSIGLKLTAEEVSPVLQIGLRSGLALVLVWPVILWKGPRLQWFGSVALTGWLGGLLFAVNYYLAGEALQYTTASHSIVLLYTAPIFSAVGLHIWIRAERLTAVQWLGIAVATLGIAYAFLSPSGRAQEKVPTSNNWGDFLALLSGLVWGAGTVLTRVTRLSTIPATHVLFYQLSAGFLILTGQACLSGNFQLTLSNALLVNMVFQAVVVSCLSFFMWFWLLTRYKASQLGAFSFMTPIFGVILGNFLLNEPLTAGFIVGTVIVLTGISIVTLHPWIAQKLRQNTTGLPPEK